MQRAGRTIGGVVDARLEDHLVLGAAGIELARDADGETVALAGLP